MAQHTPGPWEAKGEDHSERGWCVIDATGMLVARRLTEANARLIAAAPDMLEALKAAEEWMTREVAETRRMTLPPALGIARAAIAKAEGDRS